MYVYNINIQFAHPQAPCFSELQDVVAEAICYYNSISLTATNPKRILDSFISDSRTLALRLESCQELVSAGKALRIFSQYLAKGALKEYVYSKQLFRMRAVEDKQQTAVSTGTEGLNSLRLEAIALLVSASEDTIQKVLKILKGTCGNDN